MKLLPSLDHACSWLDIALILDSSDLHPFVEETFALVANRPLPLPDARRIAKRIDLISCAGLHPRHPLYGHGLRLYDAARQLTVADAIAECAVCEPPPQVLVLISNRAPTGDWPRALGAWSRRVRLHGGEPLRQHLSWGDHLAELDGFAETPQVMRTIGELRTALGALWRREMPASPSAAPGDLLRACPRHPRPVRALKPFRDQ